MLTCNMNLETGIHYGVIPKNDLYNCGEEFFINAEDLTYKEEIESIVNGIKSSVEDLLDSDDDNLREFIEYVENKFSDNYQGDCSQMRYEQNGYILESNNDDCDLFVIKSPYYTLSALCSPCAPNAGYLRDEGNLNTYCLGPDWFDDEKTPYKIYEVKEI
jgi:hypothetical protein